MLHIFISASGDDIRPGLDRAAWFRGYEARCVDDDGAEVPRGEIGRLAVRGPTGCRYLDDLERQRGYVAERLEHHRRLLPPGRRAATSGIRRARTT